MRGKTLDCAPAAGQMGSAAKIDAIWTEDIRRDLRANSFNGCVGSLLVSETERVRVWHLHLPAGQRCSFHRHVLDYFWTCHSFGVARGYFEDGRVVDVEHYPGHTKHMSYKVGEYFLHCVENIGDTDLLFTTVEFKDSANAPLVLPDDVPRPAAFDASAFVEARD